MKDQDHETLMVIAMLFLCFGLGVALGSMGSPPPVTAPEPTCMTRRDHMHEQRAVVSTWRRWTETAAAAGECRAYVLRGDEP